MGNFYNFDYSRGARGFLAGMGTGMTVFYLAIIVFSIVCMWKVFEKAGEAGWKSLIPIYNAYVYMKICWEGKYFFYIILGAVAASILASVGIASNSSAAAGICGFLALAVYIGILVLAIISSIKLAKRFDKSNGFAVGLILLSVVFLAILAFDSSDYDRRRTDPDYKPESDDPYHA